MSVTGDLGDKLAGINNKNPNSTVSAVEGNYEEFCESLSKLRLISSILMLTCILY